MSSLSQGIEKFAIWKTKYNIATFEKEYQEILTRIQDCKNQISFWIENFPNNWYGLNIKEILKNANVIIQFENNHKYLFQVPLFVQDSNKQGKWSTIWEIQNSIQDASTTIKDDISTYLSSEEVERIRYALNDLDTEIQIIKDVNAFANDILKQNASVREILIIYSNHWKNKLSTVGEQRKKTWHGRDVQITQIAPLYFKLYKINKELNTKFNQNNFQELTKFIDNNINFIETINENEADEWLTAFKRFEHIRDNYIDQVSSIEKKYNDEALEQYTKHKSALFNYQYAVLTTEEMQAQQQTYNEKMKGIIKSNEIKTYTTQGDSDPVSLILELQCYNLNLRKYLVFLKYYYRYCVTIDKKLKNIYRNYRHNASFNKYNEVLSVYNKHVCKDLRGIRDDSHFDDLESLVLTNQSTVQNQIYELSRDQIFSKAWLSKTITSAGDKYQIFLENFDKTLQKEKESIDGLVCLLKNQGYSIDDAVNENEIEFLDLICKIRSIICHRQKIY